MGANTAELEAVVRAYFATLNDGNAEELLATLSDDIVLMLHDGDTVIGKASATAMYTRLLSNVEFGRVLHIDEVGADGDLGYVRSHSTGTVTPKATGKPGEVPARELFLLRRTDGSWKIQMYAMNHLASGEEHSVNDMVANQ